MSDDAPGRERMLAEFEKRHGRALGTRTVGTCTYCGTPLDPDLYFCHNCSTPYKSITSLVGAEKPEPVTRRALIEARAPHAMPVFWTYLALIVGLSIAVHLLLDASFAAQLLISDLAIGVVTLYFAVRHFGTLRPLFTHTGLMRSGTWIAFLLLPVCLGINWAWHAFLQDVIVVSGESWIDQLRDEGMSTGWLVFSIAVVPAITEEIAFRGLIQTWLGHALGKRRALIAASALFAAIHFSWLSLPYLFLAGLLMGWARDRSESLWPPMIIHFLHNAWVVLS